MRYAWVATEILTGRILADLPDLAVSSVKQSIGKYESTTASLPLPTAPEGWLRATLPFGSVLVLLDEAANVPVWGGVVTKRTRNSGDTVELSLATMEAYFDRRYVGNITYAQAEQNGIITDLTNRYIKAGSNGGLPVRVQTLTAGLLRDRTYEDESDKSIYSVMQELSGVEGGPEWTVGWEWQHDPERITPVLYVGTRVGNPATPGLSPNATFEIPGPVTFAELNEEFTTGKGGNDFMAVSTADADVRPQSDHIIVLDLLRPTLEERWTPSTSITSKATLNAHAQAKALILAGGTNTLSLASVTQNAPRLGVEWGIGDDIGYVVNSPAFPGGISGVVRAIGWQLDFGNPETITPILQGSE